MDIAIYLGAHCTETQPLMKALASNWRVFKRHGTHLPAPKAYRSLLSQLMTKTRGTVANQDIQDIISVEFLPDTSVERTILVNENFISAASAVLADGALYPKIEKSAWIRNLFPEHRVEFYMAIRNPASFVQGLWALQDQNALSFDAFMAGTNPAKLRWSHTIANLVRYNPETPITVWCNEDTPIIWRDIIRMIGGLEPSTPIRAGLSALKSTLTPEGYDLMLEYMRANEPSSDEAFRELSGVFLDRFVRADLKQEEIDLPGWDPALVNYMTDSYEADLEKIAELPNVTLLSS